MKVSTTALSILAFASQALAHYRFTRLITDGTAHPEFKFIRQWTPIYSNSPVTNVQDRSIRCNVNAQPAPDVATVQAGSTVGFQSDQAVSHPGPFIAYLAKAPGDVTTWDGDGNWFKIWEKGPTSISASGVTWDTSSTRWTFNIPSATPSGQYLLRIEHIGLHGASGVGGAQFYMSCAQINIVNGGNGNPGPTIRIPGGYSASDPGIQINIYYPVPTNYRVPGPAVWRG